MCCHRPFDMILLVMRTPTRYDKSCWTKSKLYIYVIFQVGLLPSCPSARFASPGGPQRYCTQVTKHWILQPFTRSRVSRRYANDSSRLRFFCVKRYKQKVSCWHSLTVEPLAVLTTRVFSQKQKWRRNRRNRMEVRGKERLGAAAPLRHFPGNYGTKKRGNLRNEVCGWRPLVICRPCGRRQLRRRRSAPVLCLTQGLRSGP